MGILDLFRRGGEDKASASPSAPAPSAPAKPAAEPQTVVAAKPRVYAPGIVMSMEDTATLAELFQVPRAERKAGWTDAFFRAVWCAALETPQPKPAFDGPDGFPYLRLHLPAKDKPFDPHSVAEQAEKLLDRGVGVAVFASPDATEPEYAMPVGVVDSLVRYDSWQGDPFDLDEVARKTVGGETMSEGLQQITTQAKQEILIGSPSNTFLPPYTAKALHRHLRDGWHIADPRVSLMVNPSMAPTRSLVIGKKFSEFPDAVTAGRHARMLLWYFPPQRSLLLQPESMETSTMRSLTDYFPADTTP